MATTRSRRTNPNSNNGDSNGNVAADLGKFMLLSALQAAVTGGTPMVPGEGVQFYDGTLIQVPNGMSYDGAREVINRAEREAETITTWSRKYNFRPNDGAYATAQVLKSRYGGAFGEATYSFFGKEPPELITVSLDAKGTTEQVPWGRVSLPGLKDTSLFIGGTVHREYGQIFYLHVEGPRKYKDEMAGFFDEVGAYLAEHSIFRGKAIVGANSPEFIDLSKFNPDEIVFSQKATSLLTSTLWLPLRHADKLRKQRIPLKRAVLLHGPYGTGKTSAGLVTALEAEKQGWTVVMARSGRDQIEDTLRTARLYQPAVVFVEDIDNETSGDTEQVTRLLEALDGATSKGSEIMMVVTTNHLERIHKGLLRPGRFDAVIEIAALDAQGIEALIKAVVGKNLGPEIDFAAVAASMEGFFPAFVREAVDRARTLAIAQTDSADGWLLSTKDLTDAAATLNEQLAAMEAAGEGTPKPALEQAFVAAVRKSVTGIGWSRDDPDDENQEPSAWLMDPEESPVNTE